MAKLNDDEQNTLVNEMIDSFDGGFDEDQFEVDYAKLDTYHQGQIDDAAREFEANAVGWDSDDD